MTEEKVRSEKNKTVILSSEEKEIYRQKLIRQLPASPLPEAPVGIINGSCMEWTRVLPSGFADLLFLDPPYNLAKDFNGWKFSRQRVTDYTGWLDEILCSLKHMLKPSASIYICGDWFTSASIFEAASRHFTVRNRITWEREKGRGAKANWKNSSEDIWFCTMGSSYIFNIDNVKLRRRVIAPYTENGSPKDWEKTHSGNYRDTHPSNIWTDITIPFWSMPENTDHPTQKSEKLLAKIILASTNEDDFVLDPFLGSGTTSVTAKKLGRRYLGIEQNEEYCLLAEKRLLLADENKNIQGFTGGVFWERNTLHLQKK
ncbi:MAG: site-specific DNA-methyltransferase [Ignavibacteria bacterium]|jgi:site-specific DNA-methyltransferase (adenine-specific)|nr:site-specific DNA-methyltransferase [Ignavibacteria bacterium]MCU7501099.1 site-specific DNA-methyltransferase [Ignavibacteria bacterium]MCU7513922.1 site-specific DNA-methyltransferase [Ignavibacteria bacterium]MCU7522129.1 site-specific DNA-methyltransferase [Ignavibacteria bacterium]MCU7526158.1 site-specific DNA-methyltransferase [Ignavibacteria bacterium]